MHICIIQSDYGCPNPSRTLVEIGATQPTSRVIQKKLEEKPALEGVKAVDVLDKASTAISDVKKQAKGKKPSSSTDETLTPFSGTMVQLGSCKNANTTKK
jgi:hypothetical protein